MKAKEIIKNVCENLDKQELLESQYFNATGNVLSNQNQKDLNKILKCLNDITEEISTNYIPLLKSKKIELVDGKINVFDIDTKIQEIISVKSKNGKNLKYKIIADKMLCFANTAEVIYKVYPNEMNLESDAETFCGKLSARILAYGVTADFCYKEMLYNDASVWETRFKNALFLAQSKKGEIKLKKRGWY